MKKPIEKMNLYYHPKENELAEFLYWHNSLREMFFNGLEIHGGTFAIIYTEKGKRKLTPDEWFQWSSGAILIEERS